MNSLSLKKIAAGVYTAKTGDKTDGVLSLVANEPKIEAINNNYSDAPLPFDGIFTEKVGNKTVVCIPRNLSERHYGPGLRFRSLATNFSVLHMRCDHYGGSDNGRTHVPTPFYLSDAGYGVFIDTPEFITFYMGGTVRTDAKNPPEEQNRGRGPWSADTPSEFVEASFEGDADVYVFAGESMLEAVAKFNLFCGGGARIPKWGLGFWHRTHTQFDENDVKNEIKLFEERNFDLDVIGLEPGWHSNSYPCSYEWDEQRFPDPKEFVSSLLKKDIRVNLWENLFVSKKAKIYEEIMPFCGSHKVWNGIVPDFTLEKAREIIANQHKKEHIDIGVSGYKIDECDGYDEWLFPDHTSFPSGRSAAAVRNTLGILAQKNIYNAFRKENKRTYGLVRASAAGSAMMPFCIYNDCYSFEQYLTGLASSSLTGCLWVPEVRDAQTPEEWVRRFQMCVFSPMLMLNAWANGVKPWKFKEVEDTVRETVRFRKSLLPYLYNAFYTYAEKGIPPFRAMCLDFSGTGSQKRSGLDHTESPYETLRLFDTYDQYMAGDSIMVCPMRPGEKTRKISLPAGEWYDWYTGEYAGSGEMLQIECPLEKIPLYVKGGAMIPTVEKDGSLTVRCYGNSGSGFLYDDDGESFDFENGKYAYCEMSFIKENGAVTGKIEKTRGDGFVSEYKAVRFI
jgi:alpha-D-xyloside xylohydrolase